MTEPRIQYAKTSDGGSIGFWTLGEGMPLVIMPNMPVSDAQLEWSTRGRTQEYRHWYERLVEKRQVVRYDNRGSGLSDRDVADLSLDALVLDLEAVVQRLNLDRFSLFGLYNSGPVAIAYAVRHPERVSKLLLWCTWARTRDTASPTLRGLRRLLDTDWDVARRLASRIPDARLAVLEGESAAPYLGDMEAVASAIDEFLAEGEKRETKAELPEGMAVILFADIAESTALTEKLGDAAFREKARGLDTSLRAIIRECSGTPVEGKVLGDGVLAVFTSARQAIDCALRCDAASEPGGGEVGLGIPPRGGLPGG